MAIEPWQGGGIPEPSSPKGRREHTRIIDEVRLDALRLAGEVALVEKSMQLFVDMTARRRNLAGTDEELNAVLMNLQLGSLNRIQRMLDQRHSSFSL